MLGQALNHKATIESWRATNVFGTTIWMYNELWPTGLLPFLLSLQF